MPESEWLWQPSGCGRKDNPGVPLASQNSKSKSRLGVRQYDAVMHRILCWSGNDSSSRPPSQGSSNYSKARAVGFPTSKSLQKPGPSPHLALEIIELLELVSFWCRPDSLGPSHSHTRSTMPGPGRPGPWSVLAVEIDWR